MAAQGISSHWLRHTTLTRVERLFGYGPARTYAGHTDSVGPATTTYIKADLQAVATARGCHDRPTTPARNLGRQTCHGVAPFARRLCPGGHEFTFGLWLSYRQFTARYSIVAMAWGTVELEPEVRDWLEALPTDYFAHVAFYVDLLAEQGVLLGEPYTKQLDGKLRELRFYLERDAVRITYWIAAGRRIVLLTVFRKTRRHEQGEIDRARRALARCVAAQHTAEDEED